jgi:hypothetical protein
MTISTTTLKNAAFAIEHDLFTDPDGANYLVKDGAIVRRWEPEHSSADSFELMARLNLELQSLYGCECVRADDYYGDNCSDVDWTGDIAQDYRTAILMTAAKIGESLQ